MDSAQLHEQGIYFYHIPKTAGISVLRFLEKALPGQLICPWWLWDQLIAVPRSQLKQWTVFRGHFLSHLEPYLGRQLRKFTFLRDPVERTISQYYHVQRAPEHPYHEHALRMSLLEFCRDSETRHMVENYQSQYLAKAPRSPFVAALHLSAKDFQRLQLQEIMQGPDLGYSDTTLLQRAKQRLSTFVAVGITEDFDKSLSHVSARLGLPAPVHSSARNNAGYNRVSREHLDGATVDVIRELTQVDAQLYEFVASNAKTPAAHELLVQV